MRILIPLFVTFVLPFAPALAQSDAAKAGLGHLAGEQDPAKKPAEQGKQQGEKEKGEKGAKDSLWLTSYDEALKRAKKEKKVVLMDFTGSDWCGWCIKLKDEVFSKPEFEAWATENVILLEVDFPRKKQLPAELKAQNEKLREQFGIRGYPTIVFVNAEGKQVGQMGYQPGGPEKWTQAAERFVKQGKKK